MAFAIVAYKSCHLLLLHAKVIAALIQFWHGIRVRKVYWLIEIGSTLLFALKSLNRKFYQILHSLTCNFRNIGIVEINKNNVREILFCQSKSKVSNCAFLEWNWPSPHSKKSWAVTRQSFTSNTVLIFAKNKLAAKIRLKLQPNN